MIRATARVLKPEDVTLQITLSLTVGEWKQVAAKMPDEWPHWQLASVIRNAVEQTVGHVSHETAEITS